MIGEAIDGPHDLIVGAKAFWYLVQAMPVLVL